MKFISISGVTTETQLEQIAEIKKDYAIFDKEYQLVIGFLASENTLSKKSSARRPKLADFPELVFKARQLGLIPALHYHTKTPTTIIDDIEVFYDLVDFDVSFNFLQLNVKNLNLEIVKNVAETFDETEIIYKIRDSYKRSVFGSQFLNETKVLKDYINYYMFDPSHGKGDSFEINHLRHYELIPHFVNMVFAGGFSPDNIIDRLLEISERHTDFSIDVESGVRTDDKLDMNKVRAYLKGCQYVLESTSFLRENEKRFNVPPKNEGRFNIPPENERTYTDETKEELGKQSFG